MLLRNSFSALFSNMDSVFKLLIYIFVLILICFALLTTVFTPIIDAVASTPDWDETIIKSINDWLSTGNREAFKEFSLKIKDTFDSNISTIFTAIGMAVLVMFVFKFFIGLLFVPLGYVLYNRMSKNFDVKLHYAVVANFGKSLLFALIYALFTVVTDVLFIVLGVYLVKWMIGGIGIIALTITAAVIICLFTVRISVLSQWVPYIVSENMSVDKSFRQSFKQFGKMWKKLLPTNCFIIIFMFSIVMATGISTFMIMPIIVIPAYLVLIESVNNIAYISSKGDKFYMDEKTIV